MQQKYNMHVFSYNPFTHSHEGITTYKNNDINKLILAILEEIRHNRILIEGYDGLNSVVNEMSEQFEESNISPQDDQDGEYSFFGVCNSIENNIKGLLKSDILDSKKFIVLREQLEIYLSIVDYVPLADDVCILQIEIFENSRDFAKYFFKHITNAINKDHPLYPIKQRIEDICSMIDNRDFPNNDYDEGVLDEWIAIYRLIIDAQD